MSDRQSSSRGTKVLCPCCRRLVSQRTAQSHTRSLVAQRPESMQPIQSPPPFTEDEDMGAPIEDDGELLGGAAGATGAPVPTNGASGTQPSPLDEEMEEEQDGPAFDLDLALEQFLREDQDGEGGIAGDENNDDVGPGSWEPDDNDNENEPEIDSDEEIDEEWRHRWEEEWLAEGQRFCKPCNSRIPAVQRTNGHSFPQMKMGFLRRI